MDATLASAAIAVSMILVALGVSNGQVDPKIGSSMLFVLPAIFVTLASRKSCTFSFGKGDC